MPGSLEIVNVMAASLDGRIAARDGEPDDEREHSGFTHPDDKAHLLELVRGADAVIVGAQSVIASGAAFEETNARGVVPTWVVMTRRGLPAALPFWRQTRVPKWIVSPAALAGPPAPPAAGAGGDTRFLTYGDAHPARHVHAALAAAGARRALLFGGATINRLFYEAALVDSLWLTVCPLILGKKGAVPLVEEALPHPVRLRLARSHSRGDLVFLNYHVQKS